MRGTDRTMQSVKESQNSLLRPRKFEMWPSLRCHWRYGGKNEGNVSLGEQFWFELPGFLWPLYPFHSVPPLQACEIRHVNLNPYMGVCAEFPDVCIVSEYCAKGSLQVLELIGAWDWNRQKGPFLMRFCGDPVISIAIFVALKPQPAAMPCMFFSCHTTLTVRIQEE